MQTDLLGVLAALFFALSVVHFLRAEWYRRQMERQGREFAAGVQALLARQDTRQPTPTPRRPVA